MGAVLVYQPLSRKGSYPYLHYYRVYRIRRCIPHPPPGRFSMVDISTVGIVPVPNTVGVGKTCRRELSEDLSVRYWHPLACRAIELGKPPPGVCGTHCCCRICTVCHSGRAALYLTQKLDIKNIFLAKRNKAIPMAHDGAYRESKKHQKLQKLETAGGSKRLKTKGPKQYIPKR